ncbi:hypothetical protein K1719_001684 [Acacia pycnantha]|nr:hypothetical protein K1719_001684 [Acacia pycnantha]
MISLRKSAVAIAGIIGLAAISHRRLCHYLTSSKSHIHKTQFKDEKRTKDDSEPQPRAPYFEWPQGYSCNSNAFDALEWRKPILGNVMEAIVDHNTHLIGVYGSDDAIKDDLLEKVYRRVQRDKMFGMVLRASLTKYPDLRKIQENIASQLGLTFNHISKDKRAMELIHRIKNKQSILIVLRDLNKGIELSKVGIPYGAAHKGFNNVAIAETIGLASNLHRLLCHYPPSSKSHIHKTQFKDEKRNKDDSEPQPTVMIACGDYAITDALLEKVYRRVQRDKVFGMIVRAPITKYPDLRKIQENIASQLGLTFSHVSKENRAM